MSEETDPLKGKRILKHILAIASGISGTAVIYLLKEQPDDWYTYGVCALIFWISFARVYEFFLGLPMRVPRSRGFVSSWESIPVEKKGLRVFNLIMYLAVIGGTSYVFLFLEFYAAGGTP